MIMLELLKQRLKKYNLFPVLAMGDSHSAMAQWWAYEAIYSYEQGDLEDMRRYAQWSHRELDALDKLEDNMNTLENIVNLMSKKEKKWWQI